jgi:hypothetical protein
MQDEKFIEDFLREVRTYQPGLPPPSLLELVTYKEQLFPDTEAKGDQHAAFRLSVIYRLHTSFSLDDRAFIRFLLEQEIAFHKGMWGFNWSIKWCAFLLFVLAEVEDVQLLWDDDDKPYTGAVGIVPCADPVPTVFLRSTMTFQVREDDENGLSLTILPHPFTNFPRKMAQRYRLCRKIHFYQRLCRQDMELLLELRQRIHRSWCHTRAWSI